MSIPFPEQSFFSGNYAPVTFEADAPDLPLRGELPKELAGTLYRNGPNPQFAPYGVAARAALESQGLWKEVEPKIVYGENVRQALQFAESGNVEAVITSWTLLNGKGTLLPAEWHSPIRQTGAVVKSSKQPDAARRFLKFLMSPEAQKILQDGGLWSNKGS